jgi:hypothetical protein
MLVEIVSKRRDLYDLISVGWVGVWAILASRDVTY